MRVSPAFQDGFSPEQRNFRIKEQDARFQAAMRRELVIMAAEKGKILRFTKRPRDVLLVTQEPSPASGDVLPTPAVQIIKEVCLKHHITREEILGRRRSENIVVARHEAFFRMSKETSLSLAQIGQRLGGRDHTTVLHGLRRHAQRMEAGQS